LDITKALKQCATPAEFYRIRILIENILTPSEVLMLARSAEQFFEPARAWLKEFCNALQSGHTQIQNFQRKPITSSIELFQSAGNDQGDKTLLLSFCGAYPFRPLALPTAIFLQHIPAERFDVLVLRDPAGLFFLKGVSNYVQSIDALADRIAAEISHTRYRAVRSCGISAGGYAALVVGELLNAECAVSFSTGHPASFLRSSKLTVAGLDGYEADRMLAKRDRRSVTKMLNIFGQENLKDREVAKSLSQTFPGLHNLAVAGIKSHLVVVELIRKNALKKFLDRTLLGALDPAIYAHQN
jgi:hypothetical protein